MIHKRRPEEFEQAAKHSNSLAGMCRALGLKPSGGNYRLMHNAIAKYNINTDHFTGQGWNKGLKFKPSVGIELKDVLVPNSPYQSYKLKKRLLSEGIKKHICESCGLTEWQDHIIPLELHHINGDNRDNRLENLMLLCPNCHALTECYRGKKKRAPALIKLSK